MIFRIVNHIATKDGETHETVDAARVHELTEFFKKTDSLAGDKPDGLAECILAAWPRILEIMTSEPGEEKPKARRRRSDFGTKRPTKPDQAQPVVNRNALPTDPPNQREDSYSARIKGKI